MYKIALHSPDIDFKDSSKIINKCLKSSWVSTDGNLVKIFENKISNFTGAKYTVACNSGTAALQVSIRLAGVGKGDEVIVPTLTFAATVNAIIYNNAAPIFMDCDEYYNIDINKTIKFLKLNTFFKNGFTFNKKTEKKIKAIIPVHVWGNAVKLEKLQTLCKRKNIKIIEDASEALGTFLKSNKGKVHVGLNSLAGCLSFNANKIITSGGGGAIITNNREVAQKAYYLTTQAKEKSIEYIHKDVGYNFRLTNLAAALGISQVNQIIKKLKIKKKLYKKYYEKISKIEGLNLAKVPDYSENNHWMNLLQINKKKYYLNKNKLIKKFLKKGVLVRPVWRLNHLQVPFRKFQRYNITNAVDLFNISICIPSGTKTNNKAINYIVGLLKKK